MMCLRCVSRAGRITRDTGTHLHPRSVIIRLLAASRQNARENAGKRVEVMSRKMVVTWLRLMTKAGLSQEVG